MLDADRCGKSRGEAVLPFPTALAAALAVHGQLSNGVSKPHSPFPG